MTTTRLFAVCLALAAAAPLHAQAVRGSFVDRAGTPVPSARVVLQNESGRAVQSALTDAQGRFAVRAPAPGRYVLRGERVGFASTLSEPLTLAAGEEATHRLVASSDRVVLDAVVVEGQPRCALRPGTSEETAVVWDEVRKALSLVNANAQAPLARFTVELFEREVTNATGAVTVDNRRRVDGLAHKPFVPVDPERLATQGFIERGGDTVLYAAPDADVLLSDRFLEDHCFRLRTEGAPAPGLIGLAFDPVRGRRVPDVQGVLWLDRATAELRLMEFEYTRAPIRGPRGVPGGRMEFQRLPDGRWITASWVVRMPVEDGRAQMYPAQEQRSRVVATREMGGSVQPPGALASAAAPAEAAPGQPPAATEVVAARAEPAADAASPAPALASTTLTAQAAPAAQRPPTATERRRRIAREEVADTRMGTAFDVVQALRPNWLRTRGSDIMRVGMVQTLKGPVPGVVDESPVMLYVDGRLAGEVELLRSIPHGDIDHIEYYDAAEAQQRWGIGHPQGAIHVITRRSRS